MFSKRSLSNPEERVIHFTPGSNPPHVGPEVVWKPGRIDGGIWEQGSRSGKGLNGLGSVVCATWLESMPVPRRRVSRGESQLGCNPCPRACCHQSLVLCERTLARAILARLVGSDLVKEGSEEACIGSGNGHAGVSLLADCGACEACISS